MANKDDLLEEDLDGLILIEVLAELVANTGQEEKIINRDKIKRNIETLSFLDNFNYDKDDLDLRIEVVILEVKSWS